MYVLPEKLRPALARPLAPPLPTEKAVAALQGAPLVVSVGDVVTEMVLDHGLLPHLAVVDFRTKREPPRADHPLRAKLAKVHATHERFENPPARITQTMWDAVAAAFKREGPTVLEVVGEEDLAVLPAVVLAPPGTRVVYGQPNEGAVVLTVNPDSQARIRALLSEMEKR